MSTTAPTVSIEEKNKELVADFMKVFSAGDVDKILSFLSPTATWWVAGTIDGISGSKNKQEFGEMLSSLSSTSKNGAIALTPLAWTAEGERVAVETESYAELENGRTYNNLYHFVFVIKNGEIESIKEFLDTEHTRAVFLG
ncbi:hypothetical protein DFR67_103403 [Williamsia limnetica]|uniref:SnoaL-like domain-containing protein n=1 Tax=Williamsia limnetica TaxID=882452 RepID=A0A318RS26_WILLI|nr:nuclear transport factor 2 family protein [Williamsia limnetica]PYE19490.1 hypothetical protein DFR67_103403 [Williamsia limnetica]